MEQKNLHHALQIMHELCTGCSLCMKVCPSQALRVREGKAVMHSDWCIDCGECIRVCPEKAIKITADDFKRIFDYEHRLLILPSIFFGQFNNYISQAMVNNILKEMGFSEVHVPEESVDFLLEIMNHYIEENQRPVISSFCPAVIRLIQVRFPSLVNNVMRLKQPMELTAHHIRSSYSEKYKIDPASIGIFYVTPCVAKIASIKSPVGSYASPIDGVINMDDLYNRVQKESVKKLAENDEAPSLERLQLSSKAIKYTLTGGEKDNMWQAGLSVDGLHNVIDILEHLENDKIEGVDYLELRICDESCAGGILTPNNRFFAAERLRRMSKDLPDECWMPKKYMDYLASVVNVGPIAPRSLVRYHLDTNEAMKMMEKARKIKKSLPGIDCGACGTPSCKTLAEDVVCGRASVNACLFKRIAHGKAGKLSMQEAIDVMEEIWGADKFTDK